MGVCVRGGFLPIFNLNPLVSVRGAQQRAVALGHAGSVTASH